LGVIGYDAFDDGGCFGDLGHANIFAGRNIEQHSLGTADFDIEEW
jgi:hypothetical protein